MPKPQPPAQCTESIAEVLKRATDQVEPLFVPLPTHVDDRGWSLMNLFQGVMSAGGQANYSTVYPGVVKAWHRHQKQTDLWLVTHGHVKVGIYDEQADRLWSIVTGQRRPGVVVIPPPLWHGLATVGDEPASMLYYVTCQYDPSNPDEQRRDFDSVPDMHWGVEHR